MTMMCARGKVPIYVSRWSRKSFLHNWMCWDLVCFCLHSTCSGPDVVMTEATLKLSDVSDYYLFGKVTILGGKVLLIPAMKGILRAICSKALPWSWVIFKEKIYPKNKNISARTHNRGNIPLGCPLLCTMGKDGHIMSYPYCVFPNRMPSGMINLCKYIYIV